MRVLLHVMGCRLNAAEGARIRGALEAARWTVAEDGATSAQPRGTGCSSVTSGAAGGSGVPTAATDNGGAAAPAGGMPPADAFVLHSCAVTGAAQAEALRRVRAAKRAGIPEIVVAGCVANVAPEAYAIKSKSSCRDKGMTFAWQTGTTDLLGNPRVKNGAVDLGALEFCGDLGNTIYIR